MDVTVGVLVRPAAWVTRGRDRRTGVAVVRAIETEHLVPAGVQASHSDGIFDRVCTTVGEEHFVMIRWREFADGCCRAPTDQRGVLWCHCGLHGRLLPDRRHHLGVLVSDVGVHQLAGEVQVCGALEIPDPAPLPGFEHQWGPSRLSAPRVKDVGNIKIEGFGVRISHRPQPRAAGPITVPALYPAGRRFPGTTALVLPA